MITDPIANYLTSLRNAISAKKKVVTVPSSIMKQEITKILYKQGYILNYKFVNDGIQNNIMIALKYHNNMPVVRGIVRISKPGLRKYAPVTNLPVVMSGLGIAVLSTNRGLMTNKEAKILNLGGEVVCYVY